MIDWFSLMIHSSDLNNCSVVLFEENKFLSLVKVISSGGIQSPWWVTGQLCEPLRHDKQRQLFRVTLKFRLIDHTCKADFCGSFRCQKQLPRNPRGAWSMNSFTLSIISSLQIRKIPSVKWLLSDLRVIEDAVGQRTSFRGCQPAANFPVTALPHPPLFDSKAKHRNEVESGTDRRSLTNWKWNGMGQVS